MKKFFVIALMMVSCVSISKAQFAIFGLPMVQIVSVSSDHITFMGGVQVPTDAVPYGAFLPSNTLLPVAVYEAVKTRRAYWGHDWLGMGNEFMCEKAKASALVSLLKGNNSKSSTRANRGTRTSSRTSNGSRAQDSARVTEIRVDSNGVTLITDGGDYDFSE